MSGSNVNVAGSNVRFQYVNSEGPVLEFLAVFSEVYYYCIVLPYSGETLARFLIWRFGEFSNGRQIKNSPI